jgi:hypothetical protein
MIQFPLEAFSWLFDPRRNDRFRLLRRCASTLLSTAPSFEYRRCSSPSDPAFPDLRFLASRAGRQTMSVSGPCNVSRTHWGAPFPSYSFRQATSRWTKVSSLAAPRLLTASLPTLTISLLPSPKRTASSSADTAAQEDLWGIDLHREVRKVIAANGGADSSLFRPTIAALIAALKHDPKRFPKKHGKLKDARASETHFADGVTWRAVFIVNEQARTVRVIALAPHDVAYSDAEDRI